MELFILRHGEAGKRLSSMVGDRSRPLTSTGKAELLEEAKALKRTGVKFDLIVTSPLKRAYDTASIVANIYKKRISSKYGMSWPLKGLKQMCIGKYLNLGRSLQYSW